MSKKQPYSREQIEELLEKMPGERHEKAAAIAEMCGVGRYLGLGDKGAYRENDIASVICSAMEEENKNNLEAIVKPGKEILEKPKISNARVTYSFAKNLFKSLFELGEFYAYGMLPATLQKKLGKDEDNAFDYTFVNSGLNCVGEFSMVLYSVLIDNSFLGLLFGGLFGIDMIRLTLTVREDKIFGHPILTLPYHAISLPYKAARSLSRLIGDAYERKRKELESELAAKELETRNLSQLPSPEKEFQISIDNNELQVIDSNGTNLLDEAIRRKKQ